MEEIWKDVKDYEEYYEVSNMGRVRSKNRRVKCGNGYLVRQGKILKYHENSRGYLRVLLCADNIRRYKFVHRLVAVAFIKNDDKLKKIVNHKDFNPKNNKVSNLEWTTYMGNVRYSADRGRFKHTPEWKKSQTNGLVKAIGKPVIGVNLVNGFILEFPYMALAKEYGFRKPEICNCCKGDRNRKSHKGYKWFYGVQCNQP